MAIATSFIFLMFMIVPLIVGIVLIIKSRKKGLGYPACGRCGYDVSGTLGTTSARCPECGGEFGMVGILPATTRTNKAGLWIGIALLIIPFTCITTSVYIARVSFSRAQQAAQAARAAATQAAANTAAASTQAAANAASAKRATPPANPTTQP